VSEPTFNIYARAKPFGSGPPRPVRSVAVASADTSTVLATKARWATVEGDLLELLDQPAAHGESVQHAFDRKERELRSYIARLPRLERIALSEKLGAGHSEVGARLERMTTERRNRIVVFVAELARRKDVA
jgi:hypothetical protein